MALAPGHYSGVGVLIRGNGTERGAVRYAIEVGDGTFSGWLAPADESAPADSLAEFWVLPIEPPQPRLRMDDGTEVPIARLHQNGSFEPY